MRPVAVQVVDADVAALVHPAALAYEPAALVDTWTWTDTTIAACGSVRGVAVADTSAGGALAWGSNEYLALAHSRDAAPP